MQVAVLLLPGMRAFDYLAAMGVLAVDRTMLGVPHIDVRPVSPTRRVALDHGLVVEAADLCAAGEADLVVVPGIDNPAATVPKGAHVRAGTTFLRNMYETGADIASLCTGAFVVASTGLLDGRAATTHWHYCDLLRERHPEICVQDNVLYTRDPEGRLWTSAGVTAGIDLCLAIVADRFGESAAATIARCLVVPATRPGGQAQYVPARHRPAERTGAEFEELRAHLRKDLRRPWTLREMAAAAASSPRTLQRRFAAETGITPTEWLIRERVAVAQELLGDSSLTVTQVASRVGFSTPDLLRKHFTARVTISPTRYRETFSRHPRDTGIPGRAGDVDRAARSPARKAGRTRSARGDPDGIGQAT